MNEYVEPASQAVLAKRLGARKAVVGIIGLGYVGLPLAAACARAGFGTIGFDVDQSKIAQLNSGQSYIDAVSATELSGYVAGERLRATADFAELGDCDVIIICVPTPLSRYREPDLRFVEETTEAIAQHLRVGQLVVLESTTYPGTTEEIVKPWGRVHSTVSG